MPIQSPLSPFAALFLAATPLPALAESDTPTSPRVTLAASGVSDDGAAERIELADHLRTLTQEVASAVCRVHAGLDAEHGAELLEDTVAAFDTSLDALLEGDPALHINEPESHPHLRHGLEKVRAHWEPVRDAALKVLGDPNAHDAATYVLDESDGLLVEADMIEAEIAGIYSNPTELLQSDAFLLDIAGKQAMYAQRIGYEACSLLTGDEAHGDAEELERVMGYFGSALTALHDGNAALGLPAAPTDEIRILLEEAHAHWGKLQPLAETVRTGGTLTLEQKVELVDGMDAEMFRMQEITHHYALWSKRVM